jgi:hypothetical protein
MKKLLALFALLVSLLLGAVVKQTLIRGDGPNAQVQYGTLAGLLWVENGRAVIVQCSTCNLTTAPDGSKSISIAGAPRRDSIDFVAGQAAYTLSAVPIGPVDLYINGVLQKEGLDYTLSGQKIALASTGWDATDIIQARYWAK